MTDEWGSQRRTSSCRQVFVHFIHVAKCQAYVLLKTIDVGHSWIVPRGQRVHNLVVNDPVECAVSVINHWGYNTTRLKKDKIQMAGQSWRTFASSSKLSEKLGFCQKKILNWVRILVSRVTTHAGSSVQSSVLLESLKPEFSETTSSSRKLTPSKLNSLFFQRLGKLTTVCHQLI